MDTSFFIHQIDSGPQELFISISILILVISIDIYPYFIFSFDKVKVILSNFINHKYKIKVIFKRPFIELNIINKKKLLKIELELSEKYLRNGDFIYI